MRSPIHNVGGWTARRAARNGERPALVDAERRLDYRALEARCRRAAGWLRAAGVERGDRVALLLANRTAYLELVFAAARLGAVALPVNTRLAPPEVREILDDAEPRALVHEAELEGLVERACAGASAPPAARLAAGGAPDAYEAALEASEAVAEVAAVAPEDPVILMYTSGTTGTPKGALLPHRKTLFNCLNAQLFFDLVKQDRVLAVVPLFHSFGLKILALPALYAGACVVLRRRFEPAALLRDVEAEGISYLGGVPTMFRALEETLAGPEAPAVSLESLRFLFTAGAAIPVELVRAFEARGLVLKQGFGQTETSILCCLDAEDAIRKAGSVGRPVFHADVRIVRPSSLAREPEEWEDCDVGEAGEIVARGPITMTGYWRRPEATAATLRGEWLRTGDLATLDDEGYVTLTGRSKELFISGGENVYPRQVEAVYEGHPAVREIAVVGVPDPRWGEVGRAYVVFEEGASAEGDELAAWGRERLASFKVPKRFVGVKALPKTVTGKVQKFRLLEEEPEAGA